MDVPLDSVINRAEVDWKSRLPALQRKVAMALLESGDPKAAQEILLRKPIVLPDGTLKANLDFMDLPGEINNVGNHEAVAEVDRDGYLRDDHPERISGGVLVSHQSQSYDRLTDHLGDYDDDPEATTRSTTSSPTPTVEPSSVPRMPFSTTTATGIHPESRTNTPTISRS